MTGKKIAFVVQRYGIEVNGGAEQHCRLLAEHLAKYFDIDVLTTCAVDYVRWKNYYKVGEEFINGVRVIRFPVDYTRRRYMFGLLSRIIYNFPHPEMMEYLWMKFQGPYSSGLLNFIKKNNDNYFCFIFFTYLYCTTFFGIQLVKDKSILIPTAEFTPQLKLNIFKNVFNVPRMIIYNTSEEKNIINKLFRNEHIPSTILGVGVNIPAKIHPAQFKKKYNITDSFILYIGRITVDKGCDELFKYFIRYKEEHNNKLKLVLIGKNYMKIPLHPDIFHLGFLPDEEKFSALQSAELLVLPSRFESLSMVLLEAWSMGKPVLINSECDVTKGQVERSKGGLMYSDYNEFKNSLNALLNNKNLSYELGINGQKYFVENYSWEKIERRYLEIIKNVI
jgi:glycosyltransferase involved in cell wall biosynthesis